MASQSDSISFIVTFQGIPHALTISPATTLVELLLQIGKLTGVSPALQKLLYRNKKFPGNYDVKQMTVTQAGFKNNIKVQMVGCLAQTLDRIRSVETEHSHVEKILRE